MTPNYRLLDIKYLITKKIPLIVLGKIKRNLLPVYYVRWSNNFGDLLTLMILKYYGFTPVFSYQKRAKCVVIGTILELIPFDFSGYILGSGWTRSRKGNFPNAIFMGVRGFLTKEYLDIKDDVCIGDPGLLISEIYPCSKLEKKYKLGIIPHESEIEDSKTKKIKNRLGNKCIIISPRNRNPQKVLELINSCEYIVSSSLHGLIVSDSYGIPNGWIKINEIDDSKDFKFYDYYSSLGETLTPFQINGNEFIEDFINICRAPQVAKIMKIREKLNRMFLNFKIDIHK